MYLSRLLLNPRRREVRRLLSDCQTMHALVMSAFPDSIGEAARSRLRILYRVDDFRGGAVELLVQSRVEPDWSVLGSELLARAPDDGGVGCKPVAHRYAAIVSGTLLAFRLRANPTRKIDTRSGPDGERRHGRRVELPAERDLVEWLARKGTGGGFELAQVAARAGVPDIRARREPKVAAIRRESAQTRHLTFAPVLFEGLLRVTDPDRFRSTLAEGIGPAKAYGFGLLSIARPSSFR